MLMKEPPPELPDPNWNLMDHSSPVAQLNYLLRQLHRMAHTRRYGRLTVDHRHTLTVDEKGFVSMVGTPSITEDILRQPTTPLMHGDQGSENFDAMIHQATRPPTGDALQRLCPLVEDVTRIIESSPVSYTTYGPHFTQSFQRIR